MTKAVLALGSNLGDRAGTMATAVRRIADCPGVELTAISKFYESIAITPSGPDTNAPAYLNAVAIVETMLEPLDLLSAVHEIENDLGRVRSARWADRTLDIDIITYGQLELSSEVLTIPHPRAAERAFVLEPWLSIDVDAVLPGLGRVVDLVGGAK